MTYMQNGRTLHCSIQNAAHEAAATGPGTFFYAGKNRINALSAGLCFFFIKDYWFFEKFTLIL